MQRVRSVAALGLAAVVFVAGCTGNRAPAAAPTAAATAGQPLEATEIGVTPTELHVAVVADVDTPISPGLSHPLVVAVQKWGDRVNAAGGLAGRKVVVDFYDSKLNPDNSSNAFIQACQNDFASVGSGAFVMLNPDPINTCADKAGKASGFPDLAALAISQGQGAAKTTYGLILAGQDYKADGAPYVIAQYGWDYYEQKLGTTPKAVVISPGTPGSDANAQVQVQAMQKRGWDTAGVISYADVAPQSEATPIVNRIKNEGINLVFSVSVGIGKIMAEAKIQGLDMSKIVWVCTSQCETPAFLKQNPDANGLYVSQLLTPPSDTKVPGVASYTTDVAQADQSANGEASYAMGLAFQELIDKLVKDKGPNGLTRQNLISLLDSKPTVSAQGILDPKTVLGTWTKCWVTAQAQNGDYIRVDPAASGQFACSESGVVVMPSK
jgi:hypothetical protein